MKPFKAPQRNPVPPPAPVRPREQDASHALKNNNRLNSTRSEGSQLDRDTASTSTFSHIASPTSTKLRDALKELPNGKGKGKEDGGEENEVGRRFKKEKGSVRDIEWVFKSVFKKSAYRGLQEDIMNAALQGADILVIAPTGMGKSLCFQVPAVAEVHGTTLVVSPLLSLMQDQIFALEALGVKCAMLSSKTSVAKQKEILADMESGHPKNRLLYVTPERLLSPAFKRRLDIIYKQRELNRLVVDEAHCISEWGHDFRPDYFKLGNFRAEYPKVPIMAVTASATPKVQDDIVEELGMKLELVKVVHPFNRLNLFYEVRYYSDSAGPDHRRNDLISFINKLGARSSETVAGIVYCRAKNTCDDLAAWLRERGIMAASYHRGLKDTEADQNQMRWLRNDELAEKGLPRVDCIIATIAFGMGIDKGNCRYVVHYDIPKSFEGYYQGRYFGEKILQEQTKQYCDRMCDVCRDPEKIKKRRKEGLVELTFEATQAVYARVDSDYESEDERDPDQYEASGKQTAVSEDEEESDEEGGGVAKIVGREGFRTAAVERDREIERSRGSTMTTDLLDRQEDQVPDARQPPPALVESEDDDDDEVEILPVRQATPPLPQLPPSKKRKITISISPESSERELSDDELPDISIAKTMAARVNSGKVKEALHPKSTNHREAGPSNPKPPAQASKAPAFVPPFKDFTRNAKHHENGLLKAPGETASSVADDVPARFEVNPLVYEKKIPSELRREAVVHFVKHLGRIFFSKHGFRSSESEEVIWKALGAKSATHEQRRKIILHAAIEIESDIFWLSVTPTGYRIIFLERSSAIQSLESAKDPLHPDSGDGNAHEVAVKPVFRSIKTLVTKPKKKKRKVVEVEQEEQNEGEDD